MFDSQSEKVERAKINDERLQALLNGEKQTPAVRRFLGIEQRGSYPVRSEFPKSFVLAGEISNKIRQITRDTMRDKKHREREVWVGLKSNSYVLSPIHIGTENEISHNHRNLFPNIDWDFPLMEVHTHGPKDDNVLSVVSPQDVAVLDRSRHIPALTVSHDGGLWMLVKTGEFYSNHAPLSLEDIGRREEKIIQILRGFKSKSLGEELEFMSTAARSLNCVFYTFLSSPPKKSIIDFDNKDVVLTLVD